MIRTLTILEGLALNVDPDFKLVQGAYPYIARQVLGDESAPMRALLRRALVLGEGDAARINWAELEKLTSISAGADAADLGGLRAARAARASTATRSRGRAARRPRPPRRSAARPAL